MNPQKESKLENYQKVIEKYFGDRHILWYDNVDLIKNNHYIKVETASRDRVIISIGDDDNLLMFKVCNNPKQLDKVIKFILYD